MNHPHNDDEDQQPTTVTTTFPRLYLLFGVTVMFVLAVDEIDRFKGCPSYWPTTSESP